MQFQKVESSYIVHVEKGEEVDGKTLHKLLH